MTIEALAYWSEVNAIAVQFPGAEAGVSYGTPAFKAAKKLFARLKEDGKTLALYTREREKWMQQDPVLFFITDHYKNAPLMLINPATVSKKDLKALLLASWQQRAPKRC